MGELVGALVTSPDVPGIHRIAALIDSDTVELSAPGVSSAPLHTLQSPQVTNPLRSSLPWQGLVTPADIHHYLDLVRNYPNIGNGILEAQFYYVVLPTLDHCYGAKSAFPPEEVREYYQLVTKCVQQWFLSQRYESAQYRSIMFHIAKKIYAATALWGYGDGYRLGLLLGASPATHSSFALSLSSELDACILQFIRKPTVSLAVLAELVDQLVPALSVHFPTLLDAVFERIVPAITADSGAIKDPAVISVLYQLYNVNHCYRSQDVFDLLIQTMRESLQSADTRNTAFPLFVPLVSRCCTYIPEKASQLPLSEAAAQVPSLPLPFRGHMLSTFLSDSVYPVLSPLPEFQHFLTALCSISTVARLFVQSKWEELAKLLARGVRLSHCSGPQADLQPAVEVALSHHIPIRVLPLIDYFPIASTQFQLYLSQFSGAKRTEVLETVCLRSRNWCETQCLLTGQESTVLYQIYRRRLSLFALFFAREHSATRINKLPRLLTFHITEYI